MKFGDWLKGLFNPKVWLGKAVDALDKAVPFVASEIDKEKEKLNGKTSTEQAQWLIDKTKEFLKAHLNLG